MSCKMPAMGATGTTQAERTGFREAYHRDGFYFPLRAMGRDDAERYVAALEAHELAHGGPLQSSMRHHVHLLFTWANRLVRHPRILDPVEHVIGPNILCGPGDRTITLLSPGFAVDHHVPVCTILRLVLAWAA